ncbi:MAG: PhnD/SsuA/transferrin family substrate-binding protein [Methylacidiphilales bacterium]|nr:PhnD/SsuA/transferrin family substrate-binding protein [Candidatus Methylacidiphilales bacterium]
MVKWMRWIFCFLVGAIMWAGVLAGCFRGGEGEREGGAVDKRWRIALKADKNPESMFEVRQGLEVALRQIAGREVEVVVPTAGGVVFEGLRNGSLDAAYVSALEYLQGSREGGVVAELGQEVKGRMFYESVWVVRADASYRSVDELRGKPVCFASRTSTSGYLVPLANLVQTGRLRYGGKAEEFFGVGNVYFGTGYVSAIERLLNGQVEAAAVSDYVMEGDKHLTKEQKEKLRILARQGPVPTHLIVMRAGLAEEERAALRAALMRLNEVEWVALRDRAFAGALVAVDGEEHVRSLLQMLEMIGQKP